VNNKILTSILTITLVLSLLILVTNQPAASACIFLGRKTKFNMELSPKIPLFHPDQDGYLYPDSPKITKNLIVSNIGNIPFRIRRLNATFYQDTQLANGLQIEILELGRGRGRKPHLLFSGTLSDLSEGVEVCGKKAVPPKESITLQITVWMPKEAGNEYQGLSMTADIAITVRFPPSRQWRDTIAKNLEEVKRC
jgi:hypothetical protein